jgi:hypothetical protein
MTAAGTIRRPGPDEERVLAQVSESLGRQFPTLAKDALAARVRQAQARLADAPVRDFIAVLVERAVRQELAKER